MEAITGTITLVLDNFNLMATGVQTHVLDEEVCYACLGIGLVNTSIQASKYLRQVGEGAFTYANLRSLGARWNRRLMKEHRKFRRSARKGPLGWLRS